MIRTSLLFTITSFILSLQLGFLGTALADTRDVAKIINFRGEVYVSENGVSRKVKRGEWIKERMLVQTDEKSFVQFQVIDKTSVTLGPNSEIVMSTFSRGSAGVMRIYKGQVRTSLRNNYRKINEWKSKLFIRTTTAVVSAYKLIEKGSRESSFQIIYNPENQVTSLVTYEGKAIIAKLDTKVRKKKITSEYLKNILEQEDIVEVVERGQYSGVLVSESHATVAVKISPSQIETMRVNETGLPFEYEGLSENGRSFKNYRSTIPPGVDPVLFGGASRSVENELETSIGMGLTSRIVEKASKSRSDNPGTEVSAESDYNSSKDKFRPRAGGLIDIQTALYIPPPNGSAYDRNANVFIPPPSVGSYNKASGYYIAPAGYVLSAKGKFIKNSSKKSNGRYLASVDNKNNIVQDSVPNEILGRPVTYFDYERENSDLNVFRQEFNERFNNPPPALQ